MYTIEYYSAIVKQEINDLSKGFKARYIVLTARIVLEGANLGMPHTRPMGDGLFELRLKSAEGIARIMYCTLVGQKNHGVT